MRTALARHDHLIEQAVAQHAGQVVRPRGEGDSRFCVFARATDAVAAAAAIQHALQTEPWPTPARLKVRIALHTGEADLRDGDYYGSAVNRCARLRAIAHGGQTLLSQATADLARAGPHDGLGLRDMGEQRLSDLIAPEHVFQLRHPTLQDDFPPLRSLAAAPNNLPLQLTSFVGREADVAEVRALIAAHRLVTLTGTGGTGKTRLALQAAAELLDAYPDGVWFVDLAPLTDAALVPGAALAAIGAHEQPGRSAVETLIDLLGSKTALLVLDNCEHLLDASTLLADYLVHQCAGVRVLATSREVLGLGGEAIWRVPSLDTPGDGPGVLDELLRCDAIQLFLERARLVQRGFALTDANAAAVAQVCTRLDGIPLAIELAAARVAVLSAEQINERLSDRFRLLTGGSRTALRRQQTLRALVDWSHDILSPSERTLFRRLAVFRGGWTLEAAESVGGALKSQRTSERGLLRKRCSTSSRRSSRSHSSSSRRTAARSATTFWRRSVNTLRRGSSTQRRARQSGTAVATGTPLSRMRPRTSRISTRPPWRAIWRGSTTTCERRWRGARTPRAQPGSASNWRLTHIGSGSSEATARRAAG